ncbi:MAG: iron-sulfur cluster assembly protein [Candidatus Moranbacteria bacterium]|nr:iron-sulfur cluster assembly protein [Candidatus Moranbacteria bacterium]MDD3964697.1 iron-sulfur cluster assembly protein [Candidatus Moranbacteria bacterium]
MSPKKTSLKNKVIEKLKLVLDPELGISIWELGLIYEVIVNKEGVCVITMTLTTIGCPLFAQIQKEIEDRVMEIPEIEEVKIDLVFDPPWSVEKMSEDAKIRLGLD